MPTRSQETVIWIGGAWADSDEGFTVFDKYTLQPVAELKLATESHVAAAVESAVEATRNTSARARRKQALTSAASLLDEGAGPKRI